MGTDAGSPFNEHGGNLQEINLLVQNGLTPMEAVVAATKTAAEVLGLQDSLGTIEEGKMADLVVLEGDPLAEPSFFGEKGKISLVMKGGEIIFRKE
jgi:imidazolonepropionase-like amidohydrolase